MGAPPTMIFTLARAGFALSSSTVSRIAGDAANARLAAVMKNRAFEVRVDLGMGRFSDAVYTSDLSHGYVSINADYTP